jgi:hypothetical protein
MHFIVDAAPRGLQRSRDMLAVAFPLEHLKTTLDIIEVGM